MCTGVQVISKENHTFWGRTQEFDTFLPAKAGVVPRGYLIDYFLNEPFKAIYAAAGPIVHEILDGKLKIYFLDGMNEKGLTGGSFTFGNDYCKFSSVAEIKSLNKQPIRGEEFLTRTLLTCKDCADLQDRLKRLILSDEPNLLGGIILSIKQELHW